MSLAATRLRGILRGQGSASGDPAGSASLLSAVNVVCAAIGFVQILFVVRVLDVAAYGVLAIMASVVAMAANLLDVRVGDLASRLYYGPQTGRPGSRLDVLLGAVVVQAAVATALALLAGAALALWFAQRPGGSPGTAMLLLYACAEGFVTPIANLLAFTHRLRERFVALAAIQLANVVGRTLAVVAALLIRPDVVGAVCGIAAAAAWSLLLHVTASLRLWAGDADLRGHRLHVRAALAPYLTERRTLLSLSLVNYQNLLHRAADTLAVGWIAGDAAAGLYRFARTCTDALYVVLYEGASKVYQPLLLRLLAEGRSDEFGRRAAFLFRAAAFVVTLGLALELVTLEPLIRAVAGADYLPATAATMLLTVPVFFVVGIGLWAWPLVVHSGRVARFAAHALAAVLLGQYAVPLLGLATFGGSAATWFALGYLLSYAILYATLLPRLGACAPEVLPGLVPLAARRAPS